MMEIDEAITKERLCIPKDAPYEEKRRVKAKGNVVAQNIFYKLGFSFRDFTPESHREIKKLISKKLSNMKYDKTRIRNMARNHDQNVEDNDNDNELCSACHACCIDRHGQR